MIKNFIVQLDFRSHAVDNLDFSTLGKTRHKTAVKDRFLKVKNETEPSYFGHHPNSHKQPGFDHPFQVIYELGYRLE